MVSEPDRRSGAYRFERAMDALNEAGASDLPDNPHEISLDWQEAGVQAALAQAAYTRELAEAVRDLTATVGKAAAEPMMPVAKISEIVGDLFAALEASRRR